MLLKEHRHYFYEQIVSHKHVVMLVNADVDGLCSAKILQTLFRCDNVAYTCMPVNGQQHLQELVQAHASRVKCFVLLNCGAGINLTELLSLGADAQVYVIDCRRPIELENVYDGSQIKVVVRPDEVDRLHIPSSGDVFRADDDEEGDSDLEGDKEEEEKENEGRQQEEEEEMEGASDDDLFTNSPVKKKSKVKGRGEEEQLERLERRARRREERREWRSRRAELLFQYYEICHYGPSSSLLLFDLAHQMAKSSAEMLWWAIVGFSSLYLEGKLGVYRYDELCTSNSLLAYVRLLSSGCRQQQRRNDSATAEQEELSSSAPVDSVSISFENELRLQLFRHWSLWESLQRTPNVVCHFRLWLMTGQERLKHLLLKLGLTLGECKKRFDALDFRRREEIRETFTKDADGVISGLEMTSVIQWGEYAVRVGFRPDLSASDYVYALSSLLHLNSGNVTSNFGYALDALNLLGVDSGVQGLHRGLALYKDFLETSFLEVQSAMDQNQLVSQGSFLLCNLCSTGVGGALSHFFGCEFGLTFLGRYLLRAFLSTSRGRRHRHKPLFLVAPLQQQMADWLLIAGVPPIDEEEGRHFFGRLFSQTIKESQTDFQVEMDSFDTSVIRLKAEYRLNFFDCLQCVLYSS